MATMVTSTKIATEKSSGLGPSRPGPNGNGAGKNGHRHRGPESNANKYRIGMWVGLASIGMMFTSLSSAYIVRSNSSNDWVPLAMPRMLLVSTALILVSSVTLEFGRRKLKAALEGAYSQWLLITGVLGLGFLVSQVIAWRQLAKQGIYLVSNPHSSFFYLLSVAHAVHLVGGLIALLFLWFRSRRHVEQGEQVAKRQAATDAVSIYWHFMDALWIYLLVLLFLWR
jgi:cytochrome c oxidase subunit 3